MGDCPAAVVQVADRVAVVRVANLVAAVPVVAAKVEVVQVLALAWHNPLETQ